MVEFQLEQLTFPWRPASYTANGTTTLFAPKGTAFVVLSCYTRVVAAFDGAPTLAIGTAAAPSAVATVPLTATGLSKGAGAELVGGGCLIPQDAALQLAYTGHASATRGQVRVAITGYRVAA